MDKIVWQTYVPGDFDEIHPTEEELIGTKINYPEPAYTAVCRGRKIAAAGIVRFYTGVGEAWVAVTKYSKDYIGLPGAIKDLLEYLQTKHNFWRVQAPVKVDNPVTRRLVRWLGFQEEGVLRKYSPDGTDCYMYGRVV